jgi:hypothetical protein
MSDGLNDNKITVDDVEYDIESLSDPAKAQVSNIRFVDTQLLQLNNEWAVADTARIGYTNALKAELDNSEEGG